MKKSHFFLLVFIGCIIVSCGKENRWDCFKRTGDIVSEERQLDNFSTLETADNIEVIIIQDTLNKIIIEAGENLLGLVTSDVENGVLYLKNNNKCNWARSYKPKVIAYLHCIQLDSIVHNGYGQMTNNGLFIANHLNISINNNGNVDMNIDAVYCEVDLHQSGDLILAGNCNTLGLWTSGNNWIRCSTLNVTTAFIETKSTGNALLNCSYKLSAIVNGSGDVIYSGSPQIIETQIIGTGSVLPN